MKYYKIFVQDVNIVYTGAGNDLKFAKEKNNNNNIFVDCK